MVWQYDGCTARPQKCYLRETLALTGALLLGRQQIFADYLTGRRKLLVVLLLLGQLVLIAAGSALIWYMFANASPTVRQVVTAWSLGWSLAVWVTVAITLLRRFSAARASARVVTLIPSRSFVGEYVYSPPRQTDYWEHLKGHLRLGVSRSWKRSVFRRSAPRLVWDVDADQDFRMTQLTRWVWLTQNHFEPGLLFSAAGVCFATLNFNWVYFFLAASGLSKSGNETEHWFDWWGQDAFWRPELARRKAEEERAAAEKRAAEELRKRFPTTIVATPTRSMSAADAHAQLPDALRRLMDAEE